MYTRFASLTISIRILELKERVIIRMLSIFYEKPCPKTDWYTVFEVEQKPVEQQTCTQ